MKKKITALLLTLAMLLALAVTASADEATPTRTENLNLSAYTEVTDMLDTEGWKYEPGQNGGTLTLRDFYLKGAHNADGFSGLLTGEGTVTIVLEGGLVAAYTFRSADFQGLFPNLMEQLSLFDRFYEFVNGTFDLTAIVYYLTVIAVFVFLTVQSLEKRRWSE